MLVVVGLGCSMEMPASAQLYPVHFYFQTAVEADTNLSAKWIAAERAMVAAAAGRGDVADMAAIDKNIRGRPFRPIIAALENAYEELLVGNGVSATESPARAHAFFPAEKSENLAWTQRVGFGADVWKMRLSCSPQVPCL